MGISEGNGDGQASEECEASPHFWSVLRMARGGGHQQLSYLSSMPVT